MYKSTSPSVHRREKSRIGEDSSKLPLGWSLHSILTFFQHVGDQCLVSSALFWQCTIDERSRTNTSCGDFLHTRTRARLPGSFNPNCNSDSYVWGIRRRCSTLFDGTRGEQNFYKNLKNVEIKDFCCSSEFNMQLDSKVQSLKLEFSQTSSFMQCQ